jgi:hypothetical protein
MKYLKSALVGFVLLLSAGVIYTAYFLGWAGIFILPIIIITTYIAYYLHTQIEKENQERLEKEIALAIEDLDAEKWIKDSLVPQTISYGKRKRWTIIIYTILFVAGLIFVWQYIHQGLSTAIRDVIIVCLLFGLFIFYLYKIPSLSRQFSVILPAKLKSYHLGEWGGAYFFLLPVAIFLYFLYPPAEILKSFTSKLTSLPLFFLGYTFSFLSLYSIIYISKEMENDEKNKLERELKDLV